MARQVNINIEVQSGRAVSTLGSLKKAFDDLRASKDALGKDGKIKLEFDFGNVDVNMLKKISSDLRTVNRDMAMYHKTLGKATSANKSYSDSLSKVNAVQDGSAGTSKRATDGFMAQAGALLLLTTAMRKYSTVYLELNKSTFGVGIAGQMNLQQIGELNKAFMSMGTVVPSTAKELADATDALIRTGRSFEDSQRIIKQVAILSSASGDSLKDTAQVVTKVMVSLGIGGDRVAETLNTMHSTAIKTASDMGYLAEAFKNVAGSASVLVTKSGLAGEELDDYKQKILDVSMASIGSMANLGISAS